MTFGTVFVLCVLVALAPPTLAQERKGSGRERPAPTKQAPVKPDVRGPQRPRSPDSPSASFRGQGRRGEERDRSAQERQAPQGQSGRVSERLRRTYEPSTAGVQSGPGLQSKELQQLQPATPGQRRQSGEESRRIFTSVQQGLSSGNIGSFSQHMGSQVYVNLRGGESGYYSANQAYYLLENYFKTRRLVNFNFTTIGESDSNPYATGSAGFNEKGSRERAQVYVSLSLVGNRWVITQINIY